MKHNKLFKKLTYLGIMLSMAFMFVMANPMTALADDKKTTTQPSDTGEFKDGGLFNKATTSINKLYGYVVAITTPLAALVTLILLIIMMVSDDKESASYKKWVKKVWIIWAIINCLGALTSWGASFFEGMGYPHGGVQTIVNFLK